MSIKNFFLIPFNIYLAKKFKPRKNIFSQKPYKNLTNLDVGERKALMKFSIKIWNIKNGSLLRKLNNLTNK